MNKNHNINGAVWGFIVGDALGVPYEFTSRDSMIEAPAIEMIGFGTYNQPPGTWSDDSSMMLCVLENIINNGNTKDLARLFLRFYRDGYMTPHDNCFDIGITTRTALDNIISRNTFEKSGLEDEISAGNGSLMRCLPYAFRSDISESILNMLMDGRITHRHPLCSLCCMYYVVFIHSLIKEKNMLRAFEKAANYIRMGWRITDSEDDHFWERQKFRRLFDISFLNLPENEIRSTAYVINTLEAAVWCFYNTSNYKDAVLKAVNLGGDTDTIAALTGGLAGLYYGYDSIPDNWKSQIVKPDLINDLIIKFPSNESCN